MPSANFCKTLLAALLACLFSASLQASMPVISSGNSAPSRLLQPGTPAPTCRLTDTGGSEQTFPAAGSWNIIFYWSLFCHSCLEEIPEAQNRIMTLNRPDLKTWFVSLDTEKMQKALLNFCQKRDLKLPVLMERVASDTWVTADQWGVVSTPSVFVVAPDGKVAYSHQGPSDLDEFFAGLAAMAASGSVDLAGER